MDSAIRRIAATYDILGRAEKLTSYDNATVGSGSIDNEAQFTYDAFGQLLRDYQEHAGAVNTSTSVKVQYAASDGSTGHVRPTSMTYPNGRVLNVNYGSSGSTEDATNRVGALVDNDGSTHLVDYSYLGADSFVKADYTQPDIRWDLAFGAGNDPLDGLDRFGRVVDNRWYNYGTSADADRVQYGYDRSGSRTYREQTVDSNSYFDEVYRYDGVDRLAAMDRGPIAAQKTSVSPLKFSQCWGLDATGNWRDFREDSDGANGWNLVQGRTHNGVNEVSDITETTGPAWITPLYDRAGNMTRVPKPSDPTQYYSCTYDAWNRLVKLQDGANTVAEYKYDGAKRRIIKKTYSGGSLTETRHLYFTEPSKWQVAEERIGVSTPADRQFVWGLRYVDDLVLRDRNADSNVNTGNYGKSGSGLEERLYAMQDANWNVTALSNASGTIQERYAYTAYGTPIFLTSSFGSRSSSSYDWESLYCGYRFDTLVGLYHIRQRVYGPTLGTWVSRDPIGYSGGLSLSGYVHNSPARGVDPFGEAPIWCGCYDHWYNWNISWVQTDCWGLAKTCCTSACADSHGWSGKWDIVGAAPSDEPGLFDHCKGDWKTYDFKNCWACCVRAYDPAVWIGEKLQGDTSLEQDIATTTLVNAPLVMGRCKQMLPPGVIWYKLHPNVTVWNNWSKGMLPKGARLGGYYFVIGEGAWAWSRVLAICPYVCGRA